MLSYCQRHLLPHPLYHVRGWLELERASVCCCMRPRFCVAVRELSFHYSVITIAYHFGKSRVGDESLRFLLRGTNLPGIQLRGSNWNCAGVMPKGPQRQNGLAEWEVAMMLSDDEVDDRLWDGAYKDG